MGEHHHGPAQGISRWLFTTNHKDIGTMYLWFSFAMFLLGGFFAMVIRAELFQPGMQLVEPGFFNQMTTLYGLVMVFGAIMPSFVGLANWLIPMMIGAPDMALPRMNNWSFWILPPAFLMLASTLFMEGGAPAFGWTFYAPLSTTYAAPSVTFFIFAIHILGVSSIMGSINIIATVMNMRAPGMTYMKMPLFVWTWLITAFLLVAVMPVLAGAVTMMLMDIHFGTSFFSAACGGDHRHRHVRGGLGGVAQQVQAGAVAQVHIGQAEVEAVAVEQAPRGAERVGRGGIQFHPPQGDDEQFAKIRFVVNNQNTRSLIGHHYWNCRSG